MTKLKKKIFIAGHNGMVGSSLVSYISSKNQNYEIITESRKSLDLRNQRKVDSFFKRIKPEYVIISAAKVGGIQENNAYPANFIYDNLQIQNNLIHCSYLNNVSRLIFLGSSCIYPKFSSQPIKECELLNGHLEPTNEAYAIAKIAGIKMCESYNKQFKTDYRSLMPTNLYGFNDNFNQNSSHVIPGLLHRFHISKVNKYENIIIWGTGKPKRDFLFVEDLSDACLKILETSKEKYSKLINPSNSHINIGSGKDISIKELAKLISEIVEYKGNILFDNSKPDGTPRKILDTGLANSLGWHPNTSLKNGLKKTYRWMLNNFSQLRN